MKVIEVLRAREYNVNKIIEYYYKIVEGSMYLDTFGEFDKNMVYGIQVDKVIFEKDGNKQVETEIAEYISSNLDSVRQFCEILHKNLVSPIHLLDVLDDNIDRVLGINSKIKFVETVL